MSLRFVDSEYLPMAEHSYMWILTVRFDIETGTDDRGIVEAVIDAPQYGYDFASPFDGTVASTHPDIHGRWWRRHIGADRSNHARPNMRWTW